MAAMLDHDSLPDAGATLPLTWHWLYFLDTPRSTETAEDGHPKKGAFLPPVPLPRRMWASGIVRCIEPLRIGALAERRSAIQSVELKSGKSGDLVFVGIEHLLHQDGRPRIREEQTLVYRSIPSAQEQPAAAEPPTERADWTRTRQIDSVVLFRYSALTYNAHRIHYDRDYATGQEHYPALVIHGPLLATLLLDLALARVPDLEVSEFGFRALRPTFDTAAVALHGRRDAGRVSLWSDQEHGVTVKAYAQAKTR
jgi:3-methylfumaryl-CoA hydratase